MVAKRAYARRYAQAVFNIALEKQELEKWQTDLAKITDLGTDAAFMALVENPRVHFDDKAQLLVERLGGVNPLALNLVYLLASRGRLGMVGEIAEEYQRLWDSHRGIEPADVTTAVPLDDEDKARLAERLSNVVGKKVVIKPEVDANLLGGIVARVGGKLLDGSTRSRLEALKRELGGARK